jgi:hypothetical protein
MFILTKRKMDIFEYQGKSELINLELAIKLRRTRRKANIP